MLLLQVWMEIFQGYRLTCFGNLTAGRVDLFKLKEQKSAAPKNKRMTGWKNNHEWRCVSPNQKNGDFFELVM